MNKLNFGVVDCETATLEIAEKIAAGDPEKKKRIAIARPLIYDIGWTITDRKGNISDQKQFLVAETFSVPSVFNTAYYKDKRPLYLEKLRRGETVIKPWNEIVEIMLNDFDGVDAIGAFNSMFDFKKAIPFTDLYIQKLYSPDYYEWEKTQFAICEGIAEKAPYESKKVFEPDVFKFRGREYPLFDLWGLATEHLLDTVTYKKECLNHGMLTNSGLYFKTSAESTYRYLCNKYDFDEAHTALDDAIIETFILSKVAARHAITPGIKFFPFRDLGETVEFCKRKKKPDPAECAIVAAAIAAYLDSKVDTSPYITMLTNKHDEVKKWAA